MLNQRRNRALKIGSLRAFPYSAAPAAATADSASAAGIMPTCACPTNDARTATMGSSTTSPDAAPAAATVSASVGNSVRCGFQKLASTSGARQPNMQSATAAAVIKDSDCLAAARTRTAT